MMQPPDPGRRAFFSALPALTAGLALPAQAAEGSKPHWGMLVDTRRCIACQACTMACAMENATPEGAFRTVVATYAVTTEDDTGLSVVPRLCNHCAQPPCVPVCPVDATFKRGDGVVLVDGERCVGCAYCVQACPYDARFINHETNTADKCTFCAHRLEAGLLPACVESCVGEARIIGDLNDPKSRISRLLREHEPVLKVLKPEAHTQPRVFYLGMDEAFVSKVDGNPALRTLLTDDGKEIAHGH